MIYLATPYSHPDTQVRDRRWRDACTVAADLFEAKIQVYSPIAHAHPIVTGTDLGLDWEFWKEHDEHMIRACRILALVKMDGWKESVGMNAEREFATSLDMPIYELSFLPTPDEIEDLKTLTKRFF